MSHSPTTHRHNGLTGRSIAALIALVCAATATAGIQDESASGYYRLANHLLYFVDDGPAEIRGDGLPEAYSCDSEPLQPLTHGSVTPACDGSVSIVVGTWDADTIDRRKSTTSVVVFGGPGDDRIHGSNHDDILHGSWGVDRLWGESGHDVMAVLRAFSPGGIPGFRKGNGVQTAYGGPGNDYLFGGLDATALHGGTGNDVMQGGVDVDLLQGGPGNDALYGGFGDDKLRGGPGNDLLHGGDHADSMYGQGGSDTLIATDGGRDSIVNGGGGAAASGRDAAYIDRVEAPLVSSVVVKVEDIQIFLPGVRTLFAAVDDGSLGGAILHRINPETGAHLGSVRLSHPDGGGVRRVHALAFAPTGELWGITEDNAAQRNVARIHPMLGDLEVLLPAETGLADITFEGTGRLLGVLDLPDDVAAMVEIDQATGAVTPLGDVLLPGTPAYLAYDFPEGFLFVIMDWDGQVHLSNFESYTGRSNHVAPFLEWDDATPAARPVTWDSVRNRMLEVSPGTGHMNERARRYAEAFPLTDCDGATLAAKYGNGQAMTGISAIAMPQLTNPARPCP